MVEVEVADDDVPLTSSRVVDELLSIGLVPSVVHAVNGIHAIHSCHIEGGAEILVSVCLVRDTPPFCWDHPLNAETYFG